MSESVVTIAKMIASAPALGGYASYMALRMMYEQYAAERAAFEERSQADEAEREQTLQQQQSAMAAALVLAERTQQHFSGDIGKEFLHAQLEKLAQRIPNLPVPDPTLEARCRMLLEEVDAHPEKFEALLAAYRELADQVVTQATKAQEQAVITEIDALKEEIRAALTQKPQCAALREQLFTQLETLEHMSKQQRMLINQSLQLVRQRLHREVTSIAEREEQRARDAKALRDTVGDLLAKLQALTNQHYLPGYADRATAMLSRLGTLLGVQDAAAELQQFSAEVDALFTGCEKALEEETNKAYLQDQISDVLLNMGYQVTALPDTVHQREHTVLTQLNDDIGVEFHIENNGRLNTEMVAFSEGAAHGHDTERKKKVCGLVDEVLAALRERQCQVRERYRASITDDGALRVVEQSVVEETVVASATTPKHLQSDQ